MGRGTDGARRALITTDDVGIEVEVDARSPVAMDDAALEAERRRLEELRQTVNEAARVRMDRAVGARVALHERIKDIERVLEQRRARRERLDDAYTLEQVLDLTDIPDSLPLDALAFRDRKTGRPLRVYVSAYPVARTGSSYAWYPGQPRPGIEQTIGWLRSLRPAYVISLSATFETTGRYIDERSRFVIPRDRLAAAVVEHLRTAGQGAP